MLLENFDVGMLFGECCEGGRLLSAEDSGLVWGSGRPRTCSASLLRGPAASLIGKL